MADVPALPAPAHSQHGSRVRLEWGPTGAAVVAAETDIAVVVDVLSFTTTLSIATRRGTRVLPFGWKDERAAAYAEAQHATLAVGRLEAQHLDDPPPSLSPAQLLTSRYVDRLVLPSPNGSTICAAVRDSGAGTTVVGASLRNRAAVARWLDARLADGATVAFVPSGERWPDGTLRPAVEDLWGAGAVLDLVLTGSSVTASAEARHAVAAWRAVADGVGEELRACASGQELIDAGFGADVAAAADVDADDVVPVLTGDGFVAAGLPDARETRS
ncbi:MAG TPA: 2-phosphosulfolactate phosphatase [Nocardioides sp.]|nr:2-phosphosulfolactate phosphatase [Nocardioides sp.]